MCLECVRRGFESHLSATFSLEKGVSRLVLCCVALSFFLSLSEHLSIHVHVVRHLVWNLVSFIRACVYTHVHVVVQKGREKEFTPIVHSALLTYMCMYTYMCMCMCALVGVCLGLEG